MPGLVLEIWIMAGFWKMASKMFINDIPLLLIVLNEKVNSSMCRILSYKASWCIIIGT